MATARIRSIKPEFFFDEHIAALTFEERLAFIGLWCMADKDGRLEDSPPRIKATVFPYDALDIIKIIKNLEKGAFITRYSVKTRRYIQINNFLKHQRPHHTERPSVIPAYNGEIPVKSRLNPGYTPRRKGREGKGREIKPAGEAPPIGGVINREPVSNGDNSIPLTAIQRIVLAYKAAKGIPQDDKHWDRANFARNIHPAAEIINAFYKDVEYAVAYTALACSELNDWARKTGKSWSLNLVVKKAYEKRGAYTEERAAQDKAKHAEEARLGMAALGIKPPAKPGGDGFEGIGGVAAQFAAGLEKIKPEGENNGEK